jgi:hypothetical protein
MPSDQLSIQRHVALIPMLTYYRQTGLSYRSVGWLVETDGTSELLTWNL